MKKAKKIDILEIKKEFFKTKKITNETSTNEAIELLPLISGYSCGLTESDPQVLRSRRTIFQFGEDTPAKFRDIQLIGYNGISANTSLSTANFIFKGYATWTNVPLFRKKGFRKIDDKAISLLAQMDSEFGLYKSEYSGNPHVETSAGNFYPGTGYFLVGPRPVEGEIHLLNVNPEENTCDILIAVPNFVKWGYVDALTGMNSNAEYKSLGFKDNLEGKGFFSKEIQGKLEKALRKYDEFTGKVGRILKSQPDFKKQVIATYVY